MTPLRFKPVVNAMAAALLLLCTAPRQPICLGGLHFEPAELNRCRREIEAMQLATQKYVECLAQERQDALDRLNRAIDEWNTKAREIR